MRTLLRGTLDAASGNKAIANGTVPQVIEATVECLIPEAAYFHTGNGERSCFMVFDMQDASQIPVTAEPFFAQLNVRVDFSPVMNADELQKGLQSVMNSELVLEQ